MNLTLAMALQHPRLLPTLYPDCVEPVVQSVPKDVPTGKGRRGDLAEGESDFGALVYIVVVLVFYSAGVIIMIVRYLKTEKKELEEEVTLENFFKYMPDKRQEKEHRVNRIAIHAFHTLTSISYDDEQLEELDIISESSSSPDPLYVDGV
ncbi:unnamed protein product [Candidula unifasciata]|uniref:Uncharacterized protein n=1 Tax=Candidula unifasciata TaxID=100452 RepID=A0A8S3YRE4_9EUPU|nr:unnamed protein product [Candidula unifasciata]